MGETGGFALYREVMTQKGAVSKRAYLRRYGLRPMYGRGLWGRYVLQGDPKEEDIHR
jgi:hypothetical protein